jgi:predicted nuclease with TOPRIM domain
MDELQMIMDGIETERDNLRAENAVYRARLATAENEIKSIRAENTRLKARLAALERIITECEKDWDGWNGDTVWSDFVDSAREILRGE